MAAAPDDIVMTPFVIPELILGIVGSQQLTQVYALVGYALGRYRPDAVVSGGAAGVDTVARVAAEAVGYTPTHSTQHQPVRSGTVHEFLPRHRRWSGDGGFRQRNLWIAGSVTHLICIRSGASTTYGSGWTADRAEEMGALVLRIMLSPPGPIDWPDW